MSTFQYKNEEKKSPLILLANEVIAKFSLYRNCMSTEEGNLEKLRKTTDDDDKNKTELQL